MDAARNSSSAPAGLRAVACPLCGGGDKELAAGGLPNWHRPNDAQRYSFSRCRACGLVFLDPAPADDAEFLEDEHYHQATGRPAPAYRLYYRRLLHRLYLDYQPPVTPVIDKVLRALLRGRWARYQREHHHALLPWRGARRGRLLDVGAAAGDRAVKFARLGWQVVGVEPAAAAARSARATHGLDVRTGLLEDQHFPEASFDAVTLLSVLEHLPQPLPVLREIRRVLAADGVLFLDVPNFASRQREIFGPCWTQYCPPEHRLLPTEATLRRLLDTAGFRVEYVRQHCSLGLYKVACKRARKLGTLDPALPQDDAGIQRWLEIECAPPRAELLLALAVRA